MSFDRGLLHRLTIEPFNKSWETIKNFLPRIWDALIIIVGGWILAKILEKLMAKLLRALGLDVISEKLKVASLLKRGGVEKRLSHLVGKGISWIITFTALLMALDALGLEPALHLLQQIVYYIPRTIVSLVIILLGILLGNFLRRLVESSSRIAKIPLAFPLGEITRFGVIAFAITLALGGLGVPTSIITICFAALLGVIPLAFAIAFGLGTRNLASDITAGLIIRKSYHVGDAVEMDNYQGEIKSLELLSVSLKTSQGLINIPNSAFLNQTVIQKSPSRKD